MHSAHMKPLSKIGKLEAQDDKGVGELGRIKIRTYL